MAKREKYNKDIRAYAASKGYTLQEIANYMGLGSPKFSTRYMGYELPAETKEYLVGVIDRMVEHDSERIQNA